jgi:hypothetical protein
MIDGLSEEVTLLSGCACDTESTHAPAASHEHGHALTLGLVDGFWYDVRG